MTTISVALATYNDEDNIWAHLMSIENQDRRPDEIVIVDASSTDRTVELIEKFAKTTIIAVKIRTNYTQSQKSEAYLQACTISTSSFIALGDPDSIWRPYKLTFAFRALDEEKTVLSTHSFIDLESGRSDIVNNNFEKSNPFGSTKIYAPLKIDSYVCSRRNSIIFRRELIEAYRPEKRPQQPGHQYLLMPDVWIFTLGSALGRTAHISEPLSIYPKFRDANIDEIIEQKLDPFRSALNPELRLCIDKGRFYEQMEVIFGEISSSGRTYVARAAADARATYAVRRKWMQHRLHTYSSVSFFSRLNHAAKAAFYAMKDTNTKQRPLLHLLRDVTGFLSKKNIKGS